MGRLFLFWLLGFDCALGCRDLSPSRITQPHPRGETSSPVAAPLAPVGQGADEAAPSEPEQPADVPEHSDPAQLRLGFAEPQPQALACGDLGFVRSKASGFEVYAYRGPKMVLRQHEGVFDHVVAQAGHSYLLMGRGPSLVFYHPSPRFSPLAHLPSLGPFSVWPDSQDRQRVWVHYLRDDAVHHFSLDPLPGKAVLLGSISLPAFAGRQVVRLWNGAWVYFSANDFAAAPRLRMVIGQHQDWVGSAPQDVDALVAGMGADFWSFDGGQARKYSIDPLVRAKPMDLVELPGSPWAAVTEGGRLAVLVQQPAPGRRRWWLLVWESGRRQVFDISDWLHADEPDSAAGVGLCLAPGRRLVVMGGTGHLGVFDYAAERWLLR